MKILLFADWHLDPATRENTEHAGHVLLAAAERERPDLIVNAGDLSWRRGHIAPWVAHELRRVHVGLADLAPVIVVAGNHDLATGTDPRGMLAGALDLSRAWSGDSGADHVRRVYRQPYLQLFERPAVCADVIFWHAHDERLRLACLPYPSKSWLLAGEDVPASEINARMSAALHEVLLGLAAQIPTGERAILVYHGTVAGARTDSEQTMSTEIDLVLEEPAIPAVFEHVLCGHIHRRQQIGRAVYPGSLAPLTFAEGRSEHGYAMIDTETGAVEFRDLEPRHRLVTVDLRAHQREAVNDGSDGRYRDARVRVLLRADVGDDPVAMQRNWGEFYRNAGAYEVRVQVERPDAPRTEAPAVDGDASIAHLVALWAAERNLAADLPALTEHAVALEAELPAEVRLRARASNYRLARLAWLNWKSYGADNALDLETCGALVSIEGDNATGKSNAAEVECFALYGRTPRGRVALADLVRIGERDAEVTAEIVADGRRWTISRRLRVNSKGVGSADLRLCVRDESGELVPADLGTARETQAFIESLVGPFELYLATRYASQGDIDRLLDLTPSEMLDTLQAALATSTFEAREKLGIESARASERALAEHVASLAVWKAEADAGYERQLALGEAERRLEASRGAAQEARAVAREKELAARDARAARERVAEDAAAWDRATSAVRSAEGIAEAARRIRESVEARAATLNDCRAAALAVGPKKERLAELQAAAAAMRELKQAEAHAGETVAARRAALDGAVRLREARLDGLRREVEKIEEAAVASARWRADSVEQVEARCDREIRALEDELGRLAERARLATLAPFGEKCAEAACPLLKDALEARALIDGAGAALATARNGKTAAVASAREDAEAGNAADQQKIDEAREKVAAAENEPDTAVAEARAALEQAEDALAMTSRAIAESQLDELALRRLLAEVSDLEARAVGVSAAEEAVATLPAARSAEVEARATVEAARPALEELGERPSVEGAAAAVRAAEREHGEAYGRLAGLEAALNLDVDLVASRRASLEQSERARERMTLAAPEREKLEARRKVAALYVEAVGRQGIPYLMLRRALPAFEAAANHFLCADAGSGLALEIDDFRETQAGETRLEVAIRYANGFGSHPLSAASGFERVAIGYAMRAALALVQAEAQGVAIGHWIADEGWGVFDETNLVTIAQPMVRRLAERFGRVVLISHQAAIREVCETRLVVTGDPTLGSNLREER